MSDAMFGRIELAPIKTNEISADKNGSPFRDSQDFPGTVKISELHKRSFQNETVSGHVVWQDEFGHKFMAIDSKGIPEEGIMPFVEEDRCSTFGLRTHGLVDLVNIHGTQRKSIIMRKMGLLTERIRSLKKLESITYKGQECIVSMLKEEMLAQATVVDYARFKAYLDQTDYYVVERDMPVGERLEDVAIADRDVTGKNLKEMLKPVFVYLNMTEGLKMDINKVEDIVLYLSDILPRRMGSYLGRLHDKQLIHGFAGSKNWLTVACLVDLDSVDGVPLGGSLPTDGEVLTDLVESYTSFDSIFWLKEKDEEKNSFLYNNLGKENYLRMKKAAKIRFMREYQQEHTLSPRLARTVGRNVLR